MSGFNEALIPYFKVGDIVRLPTGKLGVIEKITTENKYKKLRARLRVRFGPAVRHKVLMFPHLVQLVQKIDEK